MLNSAAALIVCLNLGANINLAKKSLKITRTGLFTHIGDYTRCQEMAKVLFGKVVSGDVKIQIDQTFSLNDIALAHDSLEARKTTGSTVITI